ncbi:type 1 glutamine amidotransferase [Dietzia kunjamensis]|uniref:type 1 glutamine amidotransferase n=1 Tax=Dietzia kunjamensis TaxID=322509 RepID=UPI0039BD2324
MSEQNTGGGDSGTNPGGGDSGTNPGAGGSGTNPDPRNAGGRDAGASASPLDTVAADSARPSESTVRIGLVLPDVMGTYGDDGNSLVLRQRLRWRGYDAEIVRITLEDEVPDSCDLYTVGGGEDAAQKLASRHLTASPGLQRAVERGAPVLAICAGMQVFGEWFVVSDGSRAPGLGLLDVTTTPQASRSIGELVVAPQVAGLTQPLTGFENHMGATVLGPDAAPLGRVTSGVGNGVPAGQQVPAEGLVEGVVQGSIIATYMHGPALARNPELADLLLCRALGVDSLPPVEVPAVAQLRRERIAAARR